MGFLQIARSAVEDFAIREEVSNAVESVEQDI